MTVITGNQICKFRTRTLRAALKLEIKGVRRRGKSVYQIVKDEFGFKGNKQKVLDQLDKFIQNENATAG